MRNHLPGFLVSILVHTGIVILFFSVFTLQSTVKTDTEATPLTLSMFVPPEPPPVIEPQPVIPPEPVPVVEKIEPPKPKPVKKPKPKPKPKPKKKPKPEPVVEKQPEPPPEIQPVVEPPPAPTPPVVQQQSPKEVELMDEYKTAIRRSIEANKHYPRQARRLRQQGTVIVAFTILQDGSINNIKVTKSAGNSSLDKAAVKAIKKISGKYPIPEELNRNSWDFDVPMQYSLL